jgi:hypothetical protein
MAYISSTRVKEIRTELKAKFPLFKFSVTFQNYSTVSIKILEAPVMMCAKPYLQVNVYYVNKYFQGYALEVVQDILSIAQQGQKFYETGDYGRQPSHYVDLSIGDWDKPFQMILLNDKSKRIGTMKIKESKHAVNA